MGIEASAHAVRPPAPPWWPKIEQDYFAVHARGDARLAAEHDPDDYPESAEDKARHRRVLNQGAALVQRILELIQAEPTTIPAVRVAAVRYLLNRDFSFLELMIRESEDEMLGIADDEQTELRP